MVLYEADEKSGTNCPCFCFVLFFPFFNSIIYFSAEDFFARKLGANLIEKPPPKLYIFVRPCDELCQLYDKKYKYRVSTVCVNDHLKKLVRVVLEVLGSINPEKANSLLKFMKNPSDVRNALRKQKVKDFLETVKSSPIVTSKSNFTFWVGLAVEGTNLAENKFEKQIVARTLQVSPDLGFDDLLDKVRKDLFSCSKTQGNDGAAALSKAETIVSLFSRSSSSKKFAKNEKATSVSNSPVSRSQNPSVWTFNDRKGRSGFSCTTGSKVSSRSSDSQSKVHE